MTVEGVAANPFSLAGKVALVTGAGRGLGYEIAKGLAAAGAMVLVNGRDAARLAAPVEALRRCGLAAQPAAFDVTDGTAVAEAFAAIARNHQRLDVLVGNVGVRHRAAVEALSVDDFRRLVEIDLTAGFALARAAIPLMLPRGWGRILMVTSVAGPIARAGDAAYTAAKGGLAALTRALAVEYGRQGITANAIAPGYFATETNAAMVENPEVKVLLDRRCPAGRWGRPEEIAGAAVFLASGAASYVNGQVLAVDGGFSASF